MNRWTFYDVVFTDNYVPGKRQTSIFTFDEYAGSSVTEQWHNKYPHTSIVELRSDRCEGCGGLKSEKGEYYCQNHGQ